MLNFTTPHTAEKKRCDIVITQKIADFLNLKFAFVAMPKGFLVAKTSQHRKQIQITVHFIEQFKEGELFSLIYWQHSSPTNQVEHRFSFSPVQLDKPANCSLDDFLQFSNTHFNLGCWKNDIYDAFSVELKEFISEEA